MSYNFFHPYLEMLHGAAWNVQESLEGMGMSSSELAPNQIPPIGALVSGFSPGDRVFILLRIFLFAAIPLSILVAIAGYALSRKRGLIFAIIMLSFPGILSILGLWPEINFIPDGFHIGGGGALGSGLSMLSVIIPCTILGWSSMIIVADILAPDERFWHIYDHIWVAAAILAGVFFVADSQVNEHQKSVTDISKTFEESSAYLLHQVSEYESWCHTQETDSISCKWAIKVQPILRDYSLSSLGYKSIPGRTEELYAIHYSGISMSDVETIRNELDRYNQSICPRVEAPLGQAYYPTPASDKCYATPAEFCHVLSQELLRGEKSFLNVQAVSNECIVPTLVQLLQYRKKIQEKVHEDNRNKHYRWMYYVFFSILIGAKIAGSTTKVFLFSKRVGNENESGRTLYLARRALASFKNFFLICASFFFLGTDTPTRKNH